MNNEIDIVIPWVDGNDRAWQEEKAKTFNLPGDQRDIRFRDWGNLQYWFRGVEKFLPWVRKIHFVTWGHLPEWLNTENEKLHIVNHKDFIPEKYLPTFSCNPIELNFHRIEGLSEKFIYANDDMFFIKAVSPEFFFKNDLPVDCYIENPHQFSNGQIDHIIGNDMLVINKHFNKRETIKTQRKKIFSPKQGLYPLLKNLYILPIYNFCGFADPHIPYSYLKQTFIDVWEAEPELLDKTSEHKLRHTEDVNQWLFRYWQFVTGCFYPAKNNRGKFLSIGRDDEQIKNAIINQIYPTVCLNDDDPNLDFEYEKKFIIDVFEQLLPEKSSFEK